MRSRKEVELSSQASPHSHLLSTEQLAHWQGVHEVNLRRLHVSGQVLANHALQSTVLSPMAQEAAALKMFGVDAVTSASTETVSTTPDPIKSFEDIEDSANID